MRALASPWQNPRRRAVAVSASDPLRRARLVAAVEAAGYSVASPQAADMVLSDGESPRSDAPALVLGASRSEYAGVLPADATLEQIVAALHAIAVGLVVRLPGRAFTELHDTPAQELLTPRELQVLAAISAGATNKTIARQLGISLHTVKFHIESLFRKLHARSRAEAVAKGLERVRDTIEM